MLDERVIQPGTGVVRGQTSGLLGRPFGRLLGIPSHGSADADVVVDGERVVRCFGRLRWASRMVPSDGGFTEFVVPGLGASFDVRLALHGADLALSHIVVGRLRIPAPRWFSITGSTDTGPTPDQPGASRLVSKIRACAPLVRITYTATIDREAHR